MDRLSTLKNCNIFCLRQKNTKRLAFFVNPSRLSWEIISRLSDQIFNANHIALFSQAMVVLPYMDGVEGDRPTSHTWRTATVDSTVSSNNNGKVASYILVRWTAHGGGVIMRPPLTFENENNKVALPFGSPSLAHVCFFFLLLLLLFPCIVLSPLAT